MKKAVKSCHCCFGSGQEQNPWLLGQSLKRQRVRARVTLEAVAQAMGVTRGHLSYLENGKRRWQAGQEAQYLKALAT